MAEAKFNSELRVAQMIQFDDGIITSRCAELPDDWLAMDLVRVANTSGADGFLTARYKSRDEFFNQQDSYTWMYYTLVGTTMFFGGTPVVPDGTEYKLVYYGEVPVFSDTQDSWIYTKYPQLYLFASLMHADLHAVGEEQQAANLKQLAEDMIQKLNTAHLGAKASGSRVTRSRLRTFG
ncbi:MAG TPA: hypothetical protein VGG68_15580 [Caulobacteraceae bacterium]|jgi:hypothetical protein